MITQINNNKGTINNYYGMNAKELREFVLLVMGETVKRSKVGKVRKVINASTIGKVVPPVENVSPKAKKTGLPHVAIYNQEAEEVANRIDKVLDLILNPSILIFHATGHIHYTKCFEVFNAKYGKRIEMSKSTYQNLLCAFLPLVTLTTHKSRVEFIAIKNKFAMIGYPKKLAFAECEKIKRKYKIDTMGQIN